MTNETIKASGKSNRWARPVDRRIAILTKGMKDLVWDDVERLMREKYNFHPTASMTLIMTFKENNITPEDLICLTNYELTKKIAMSPDLWKQFVYIEITLLSEFFPAKNVIDKVLRWGNRWKLVNESFEEEVSLTNRLTKTKLF